MLERGQSAKFYKTDWKCNQTPMCILYRQTHSLTAQRHIKQVSTEQAEAGC